jgi:hypothetical protein
MEEYLRKKNSLVKKFNKTLELLNSKISNNIELNQQLNSIDNLLIQNNNLGNNILKSFKDNKIQKFLKQEKNSKYYESIIYEFGEYIINNLSSKIDDIKNNKDDKLYNKKLNNTNFLSLLEIKRFDKNTDSIFKNFKLISQIKKIIIITEEIENDINSKNLVIINQIQRSNEMNSLKEFLKDLYDYLNYIKKFPNKEEKINYDNLIIKYLQKLELIFKKLSFYEKEVINDKIDSLRKSQNFIQNKFQNFKSDSFFKEKKIENKNKEEDKFNKIRFILSNIINTQNNIQLSQSYINLDVL